jgi:hypothetical protein
MTLLALPPCSSRSASKSFLWQRSLKSFFVFRDWSVHTLIYQVVPNATALRKPCTLLDLVICCVLDSVCFVLPLFCVPRPSTAPHLLLAQQRSLTRFPYTRFCSTSSTKIPCFCASPATPNCKFYPVPLSASFSRRGHVCPALLSSFCVPHAVDISASPANYTSYLCSVAS